MSVYYRHLIEDGLLLDTYPNASVAYSLRKLRSAYKKVDNLLSYSEDISQAVYTKSSTIVTSNVTVAPDGLTTADKLIEDVIFNTHFLTEFYSPTIVGLDYNFSVYLKAAERIKVDFQLSSSGTARINLSTGVIEANTIPVAPTITNVGGGWWRVSGTFTATSTITNPLYRIFLINGSNLTGYLGDGVSGVYVWGFQLTQSSTVQPYEKTVVTPDNGSAIEVRRGSDSAEQDFGFNSSGELDVDSIQDFVGYNLFAWSEQLNQSYWSKTNLTVTTDTVITPDGNTTGDILYETITNNVHSFQRNLAITNGVQYSVSFWIKAEGRNFVRISSALLLSWDGVTTPTAWLNLSTGTIISQNSGFGGTVQITPDGSWYKVSYTVRANSTSASSTVIQLLLSPDGSTISYVGNVTKGIAVWGLQITESSTIRPYRKTLAIAEGQGTITTWYDQSGNGRNATQGTVSLQAVIISNGNLITNNNKVSTLWSNDGYLFSSFNTQIPIVSIFVAKRNGIDLSGQMTTFSNNSSTISSVFRWLGTNNNMGTYLNTARTHSPGDTFVGDMLLTTYKRIDEYVNVRRNNIELSGGISTGNGAINAFGNANGSGTVGYVNETILWFKDYVSLIPNIEDKINEYYDIY